MSRVVPRGDVFAVSTHVGARQIIGLGPATFYPTYADPTVSRLPLRVLTSQIRGPEATPRVKHGRAGGRHPEPCANLAQR